MAGGGGRGYADTYQGRQEDELEFLQAMFPGDCEDLRKNDAWDVRANLELADMLKTILHAMSLLSMVSLFLGCNYYAYS